MGGSATTHDRRAGLVAAACAGRARYSGGMKIYTRTGDDGTTGLFGGGRVPKASPRVEAYGTVDEANAAIGLSRAAGLGPQIDDVLRRVQDDLFTLGAELACVPGKEKNMKMTLLSAADGERLEAAIDAAEDGLPPLTSFVLPGGCAGAAALHVARTVTRRAERRVLEAAHEAPVRPELVVYLNRLSDLLFVLSRRANHEAGVPDVPWQKETNGNG
jgi:cob(I)alamin adenosyltransferase